MISAAKLGDPGSVAVRKTGAYRYFSVASIADLFIVLGIFFVLTGPNSAWSSFSAAQITALKLMVAVLCIVILSFKGARYHSYRCLCAPAIIYSGWITLEGAFSAVSPGAAVLSGLSALLVCVVPLYLREKYGRNFTIASFFWPLLMVVLIMNMFVFATSGNGIRVQENQWAYSANYIFGNKFTLAYLNMLLLGLVAFRYRSRGFALLIGALGVAACSFAHCTTGIIGITVMLVLIMAYGSVGKVLAKRWFVPILIAGMAVIASAGMWILMLPTVQNFTVEVLGKSSDFTGRLDIYVHLMDWFSRHPVVGMGSSGAVGQMVLTESGYADCQEGLFQIVLSNGLVGLVLFFWMLFSYLRESSAAGRESIGLYAFLVAMGVASLVEINLGTTFLLDLGLFACSMETPMLLRKADDSSSIRSVGDSHA